MLFVEVSERDSEDEPTGFNCGPSDLTLADWIVDALRQSLHGGVEVHHPQRINGEGRSCDYAVIVRCRPGSLDNIRMVVGGLIANWRRRGKIPSGT